MQGFLDREPLSEGPEERDYLVMTNTYGWVLIVDVTKREDPRVVSMIRLPAEGGETTAAANVVIDRENRRLMVSAYDHGLYVVDFHGPLGIKAIEVSQGEIVDEDGGRDDRVLERIEVIGQGGEALNVINPVLLWEELGLGWVGGVPSSLLWCQAISRAGDFSSDLAPVRLPKNARHRRSGAPHRRSGAPGAGRGRLLTRVETKAPRRRQATHRLPFAPRGSPASTARRCRSALARIESGCGSH